MQRVEFARREVARDRGRVALSPTGMIEQRVVDAVQPEDESEQHEGQRQAAVQYRRRFR